MENLATEIKSLVNNFLGAFKPKECRAIVNIYSSDTTLEVKKAKAISFINKDTAVVEVNRIPLQQNESIAFSTNSADTISDNFEIVFGTTGTKKVYVTTIK